MRKQLLTNMSNMHDKVLDFVLNSDSYPSAIADVVPYGKWKGYQVWRCIYSKPLIARSAYVLVDGDMIKAPTCRESYEIEGILV